MDTANSELRLTIKPAEHCRRDLVSLGEGMLRFDRRPSGIDHRGSSTFPKAEASTTLRAA